MAKIDFIPTGYKQAGNVCLLASYYHVLGYYRNVFYEKVVTDYDMRNLFVNYIDYLKHLLSKDSEAQLCPISLISRFEDSAEIVLSMLQGSTPANCITPALLENQISELLHFYCQEVRSSLEHHDGINGYLHIKEFDDYLQCHDSTLRTPNFDIIACVPPDQKTPCSYNVISEHLRKGPHNVAMVLYSVNTGCSHSIMIARNDEGIIYRDSNFTCCTRDKASHEFCFDQKSQIQEYILFQYNGKSYSKGITNSI